MGNELSGVNELSKSVFRRLREEMIKIAREVVAEALAELLKQPEEDPGPDDAAENKEADAAIF